MTVAAEKPINSPMQFLLLYQDISGMFKPIFSGQIVGNMERHSPFAVGGRGGMWHKTVI